MASDPAARYHSMKAFADSLDAYLQGNFEPPRIPVKRGPNFPRSRLLVAAIACAIILFAGILLWKLIPSGPAVQLDGLQPGAEWSGAFRFRPPIEDYTGDVVLHIERRDGQKFVGTYSTEQAKFIWRVHGTVQDGHIAWEFVEVIREATPAQVVGNASVEGTYDNQKMTVVFRHRTKKTIADMVLWSQQ
jgi:hypothetical protein